MKMSYPLVFPASRKKAAENHVGARSGNVLQGMSGILLRILADASGMITQTFGSNCKARG